MSIAAGHAYKTGPHRRAIIGGSGEKYSYVGGSSSLFVAVGRSNLAGSQRPSGLAVGDHQSPYLTSPSTFHPGPPRSLARSTGPFLPVTRSPAPTRAYLKAFKGALQRSSALLPRIHNGSCVLFVGEITCCQLWGIC